MDTNIDCCSVPNLNDVVEEIFSSCTNTENDVVPASILIDFMRPHLSNHSIGFTELRFALDPNDDNPLIDRETFYEAMRKWTARMNETESKFLGNTFKDSDMIGGNGVPFHRSTPRPSLEAAGVKHSNDSLDFSSLSPTSFYANTKDGSLGMDKLLFIEERYQELEQKHLNTLRELDLMKAQLTASDEQYSEIKQDLERTNKRLMLEQQVNADLQKTMEHNEDFKEEVSNTKKEKDHFQRMWLMTKRENVNMLKQIKELEFEKDKLEKKLSEMQCKEEQKQKEAIDMQSILELCGEENKILRQSKIDLEEKLLETKSSLEYHKDVAEHAQITIAILKNKVQTMKTFYKQKGIDLNDQILENVPSPISQTSGTPSNSPFTHSLRSSTPLKQIHHSLLRDYDLFISPRLQQQLSHPVTPSGLETPKYLKSNLLYAKSGNIFDGSFNSSGCSEGEKGNTSIHIRTLVLNSSKSGRSKNLPPVRSPVECPDLKKKKRCLSEKADSSSQSENSMLETLEDLDVSSFSDNLRTFNGQDLLSELQECKFLDNHNKCYIEEHSDFSKIVKEHENCSKIIAAKEKQIESITLEMKDVENEYNTILNKYKCLEGHIENIMKENDDLIKKNETQTNELTILKAELDSKLIEMHKTFESKNSDLIDELKELKAKRDIELRNLNELQNEKEFLQSNLDNLMKDNKNFHEEKHNLWVEIDNLRTVIEVKQKELDEMQNLKTKNDELVKEIISIKFNLEESYSEVEKLCSKLQNCSHNGKCFLERVNEKIRQQSLRFNHLEGFTKRLQENVDELGMSIDNESKKLGTLISRFEENMQLKSTQKLDDEDSASTASSENSHRRSSKRSSYGRTSGYEKQQVRINRLEEKIDDLEIELINQKTINENLKKFEYKTKDLEMEKICCQEQKECVLRELETMKCDLFMKDEMIEQLQEKQKFDSENLKQYYEKQLELTETTLIETHKKTQSTFMQEIGELKKHLDDAQKEIEIFEGMLEKKDDQIILLEKTISDISASKEEINDYEIVVAEKNSVSKLLLNANNSLEEAENRCLSLELLLDKCKMVILETVNDVIRSTSEVYNSYKYVFEDKNIDNKTLDELKTLDLRRSPVDDFTEAEIWQAHHHLKITLKVLNTLVSVGRVQNNCPSDNTSPNMKSISKFTLKRSKSQLHRFPSRDPDISSSMKDNELVPALEVGEVIAGEEIGENENTDTKDSLRERDSETNWLDRYSDDLSVQITDAPKNAIDGSTEMTELKKSFKSVGVGDSNIYEVTPPVGSKSKKCRPFMMILSVMMCLIPMCILLVHMECVRYGNNNVICPLDSFISVKKGVTY